VIRRALLLAGVLALATGQAPALGAQSDVATTRTYIQANYRLVQGAVSHFASARAAYRSVLRRARAECPGAAAGSPQSPQSTQLSYEIIGAMVIAAIRTNVPAATAFVRVAERTRWSNRGLTSSVRAYAANVKTMATLAPPDLCGDIKAWVASGYRTLSPRTVSFDQRFEPAWVAIGNVPSGLAPYERADARALLKRSDPLEKRVSDFESDAVETYGEVMNALGVLP
jgi:hypothetical protein